MKVGIVSDTHKNLAMLDKAIKNLGEIELLIHLGDCIEDVKNIKDKYAFDVVYVAGNNDNTLEDTEKIIKISGKKILLTHGHKYNVYFGLERLYFRALEKEADLVLYGHTHVQNIEWINNILFINPGSTSLPRDKAAGCIKIVFDEKGDFEVFTYRF